MKIRLVGGPGGGKVMDYPGGPTDMIKVRVPKKMSRRAKMDYLRDNYMANVYMMKPNGKGGMLIPDAALPMVQAVYRRSVHPHSRSVDFRGADAYSTMAFANLPCMHPDGSIFYEYVEGSKKEYGN